MSATVDGRTRAERTDFLHTQRRRAHGGRRQASQLTAGPRWLDETARGQFAFVDHGKVVLAFGGKPCKGARPRRGSNDSGDGGSEEEERCSIAASDVPAPLAPWVGAKVVLQRTGGLSVWGQRLPASRCEAEVIGVEGLRWRNRSMYEEPETAAEGLASAPWLWVATLSRSCTSGASSGLWARWASLPPVEDAQIVQQDSLPAAERRALRPWVTSNETADTLAFALPASAGGETWTFAWSNPVCGDEGPAQFSAVLTRPTGGSVRVAATDLFFGAPFVVADVDGDGNAEAFALHWNEADELRALVLRRNDKGRLRIDAAYVLGTTGPNPC